MRHGMSLEQREEARLGRLDMHRAGDDVRRLLDFHDRAGSG
jgi:hypothetical protein